METNQWKHKIGTGKTPVVLSLVMLLLFGGLSIWMHIEQNSVYLFCDILTAIMAAVFLLALYRSIFYKVLIGQSGFFHQTQIHNGRYYSYSELRKAWVSNGKDFSGHESSYCNFEDQDGKVTRFPFYYADKKGVDYLVKRAEAVITRADPEGDDRRHRYHIDGKTFGAAQLVSVFVAVGLMLFFEIPLLRQGGAGIVFGIIGLAFAVYILVFSLMNHFCFLVKIEEEGFYLQTTPFNGRYYLYRDIDRSWIVKKVYRRRRSTNRQYHFYLYFTDKEGKTRRFQYSDDIFHHEVEVLKERIGRK